MRGFLVLVVMLFTATTNSCRKDQLTGPFAIRPDDFLSSEKYKKLEVEIVYVNGYRPETATIDHMQSFLNARLNKPQGISFIYKSINSPGKSSYTIDDILKIEKNERVNNTKGKTISAFIFFADAHYSDASVLGTAYGSTSIAIFE